MEVDSEQGELGGAYEVSSNPIALVPSGSGGGCQRLIASKLRAIKSYCSSHFYLCTITVIWSHSQGISKQHHYY
jgi:hypothetical protein